MTDTFAGGAATAAPSATAAVPAAAGAPRSGAGAGSRRTHGAVVMGLHLNGLGVFQQMARHGIPVVGIDARPREVGFASRYGTKLVCPNPEREPERLLAFLQDLARTTGWRGVLFPTNDEFVLFISRYRDTLRRDYDFSIAPHEVLERLSNKWTFHELVTAIGLPGPRTFSPVTAEALEALAPTLEYPCILKPILTSMWKGTGRGKVFLASTPAELLAGYRRLSASAGDLVVQELVPGGDGDVYFYFAYYDQDSQPLAEFTARKIRQYPPRFGTTCCAESVWVPEMAELSRRLLTAVGYQGLVDVEFKRDPRDGQLKIIEVNPRLGLQHQLAARAGADLTLAAFQDLTGARMPQGAGPRFTQGIKWMIFDRDLESACLSFRAGQLTGREWLSSVRGPKIWAIWDRKDPRPFLTLLRPRTAAFALGVLAYAALSLVTGLFGGTRS